MDELILKGTISVIALYAAANPWFRHHNVAHPADVLAALIVFLTGVFTVGTDDATPLFASVGVAIVADLAWRFALRARNHDALVAFGAGRRHFQAISTLLPELAKSAGIPLERISCADDRPWLIGFDRVPAKAVALFAKQLDKALRPLLGLEFRRLYPATLLVMTFLAAVWRYL